MEKFTRIQDPFRAQTVLELILQEDESLIELSYDNRQKTKFVSSGLVEFWITIKAEYSTLSSKLIFIRYAMSGFQLQL